MELSALNSTTTASIVSGPTTAPRATTASVPTSSAGQASATDRIVLSPLASALHDESLTAFNALPSELRDQLASLVERGTLSGDDLHNALKHRLKEARSNAYWATFRMTANDNADLSFQATTTADDYRNALQATLQRRAGLMGKLTALEAAGQVGSADYTEASRTLGAYEMNPLLAREPTREGGHFNPFSDFNFEEGRIMHTAAEMAAAHKLKDTGIDFMAIDRALRPLGERDAASLVNERIDRPAATTVARDAEFSTDTAFMKGFSTTKESGSAASYEYIEYTEAIDIESGLIKTFRSPKTHKIKIDWDSLPNVTSQEVQDRTKYFTSVQARYP